MSFDHWLREHQALIDDVVETIVRRYHLSAAESDEFVSLVKRALAADDHALLRAFSGRSRLDTYLATIVARTHQDFQRQLRGSWQPSALSRRLGPTAMLLEELIRRDGLNFGDAVTVMQTTYRVDASRSVLHDLAQELGIAPEGEGETNRGGAGASDLRARTDRVERALADALQLLSSEDRLMLAMKYLDQAPASGIIRLLRLEPRPSYRRIERATEVIRASMLTQGVPEADIDVVLGHAPGVEAQALRLRWWKTAMPRPSH